MNPLNNPILLVVFAAIFFYVLYGVIVAPFATASSKPTNSVRRH